MRKFVLASLVVGAACAFVAVGVSQQPPPRGGFPGGGFGRGPDAVGLVHNPAVAKELNITEEQRKKIPDSLMKALAEVLDPDQMKRLKQIELQQRGPQAFTEPKIQEALSITDEQKKNIRDILDDARKETEEARENAKGNFFEAGKKMASIRKESQEKLAGVLTADQQKTWKTMLGEKFEMPQPQFGPGGPGDGKKRFEFKKKTDDK